MDESGDANWSVSEQFPVLCLSFCIFNKDKYIQDLIPKFNALKFKYWGSDNIVFHERDFSKIDQIKDKALASKYAIFRDKELKDSFMDELTHIIKNADLEIVAVLLDKKNFPKKYQEHDPYHICLSRGLRQVHDFLRNKSHDFYHQKTHFVFEKRGHKEDIELTDAFRRIKTDGGLLGKNGEYNFNKFHCEMMSKQANSTGLQIADLTAHPIGMNYLQKTQNDRAFNAIKEKLIYYNRMECKMGIYDIVHNSI